jgi:hypothetical protein
MKFIGFFDPLRAQQGFDQDLIPDHTLNSLSVMILRRIHDKEAFPFGSVGEDSRGTTTRSVGPHWVDFGQTRLGNGEASELFTLKS